MICADCEREATGEARGWMAFRADDEPGDEARLVFYCARCAHLEFGDYILDRRMRRQMRREGDI